VGALAIVWASPIAAHASPSIWVVWLLNVIYLTRLSCLSFRSETCQYSSRRILEIRIVQHVNCCSKVIVPLSSSAEPLNGIA
ncbi:hypothetical protein BD311DRAFT_747487, partial [Dichomitus squalens]